MADAASAPSADEVPQVIAVSADSDPLAESLSVVTATSTNPSANAATHRKRAKNIFLPLQKTDDRGTVLFLQKSNLKDLQLLRVLLLKLPWKAPYGQCHDTLSRREILIGFNISNNSKSSFIRK